MSRTNRYGQPIGEDLVGWEAPPSPPGRAIKGRTAVLEPLDRARHAAALFEAFADSPPSLWTYLPVDPFAEVDHLGSFIDALASRPGGQPYAVVVDGAPLGYLSYLRIDPAGGVIEIGSIAFSQRLQRTTPATEALYLLLQTAFDLGYRRCEWKCDCLNAASRAAAERLGFRYEGTFRQATHYKGRNRDTAWFAIIDADWPARQHALATWLDRHNFDQHGRQRAPLKRSESCDA